MTTPFSKKLYVALVMIFLLCGLHTPFAGADIIIDNGDPGTSSTGTWSVSGAPNPFDPADSNATSLWARGNDSYTWRFTPDATGTYEVQMWHTYTSTRGANVPVDVRHASGTDRVYVDQRFDAGQWNSLGTYSFNAGTSYSITLYSLPDPYSTCADAVRLVEIGAVNTPPVATIDSISPNPAPLGANVTFIGHGDDTDGAITAYRWDSDRDGYLGNTATLTTTVPLSEGVHLITFTVTDDEGETDTDSRYLSVQASVAEFIIDNGDPGTSFTGTWSVSGGANPYNPADPGATSLWARSNDSYTWRFTPGSTGTYEVYMWHTYASTRGTNVPVDIRHAGGTSRVTVNQLVNPGQWNRIGTYTFNAGVSYGVTIYSLPDPYSTCADAVRFVMEGAVNSPPVAAIDEITPTAALPGRTIAFTGSGTDSDGSVAAYEWYSDLDGMLSDQPFFNTASLTPGTHTIFFRVRDNEGSWSAQAVRYVVVRDCSSPVAIMLLGDSITKGVGEVVLDDLMTGYRSPLFQALKSAGYYVDFVGNRKTGLRYSPSFDIDHQGTGGITDTEVANNVYDWLSENPAEIVLLHIGTNAFSTSPDDVEDILNEIDRFELDSGTNITVVLARIINRQTAHPDTTVFNNNVESMALSRIAAGDKIVIVDQESALNYSTDMFDLLHPNNSGYAKMSAEWLQGVVDLLPVCGNVKPFIYTTPIENTPTGVVYTYQVGALGTPAPTYSLVSFPVGMTINSSSGLIEWTPGLAQRGGHTVTIRAANSQGNDTQSFVLEVSDAIIIDNGDPETSFTGTWEVSGGINPWDPADPEANSLWSRDGDTYTWRFTPLISGNYVVSMWHTAYSSRSASVPVRIAHADGTNTVIVNQQINGGMWNALGTYSFNAGATYSVTITSQPGPSSTCADAVRFELAAPSPPSITTQPISQSVTAGSTATFSVAASGAQPLNYQWQKNGANIPGATGASYTTPPCSAADNGAQFRCVVSNSAGSATSGGATLTVIQIALPNIVNQPLSQTVMAGSAATFSVSATGSPPLSYQWQKNGAVIPGATGSSYTTPATLLGDSGSQFRCVVSNPYGSVTSNSAALTVLATPPSIVAQPTNQTAAVGATATFSVTAAGSVPLSYQWQKNGTNIAGAVNSNYTTPAVTTADNGATFRCVVTNAVGSVTSGSATLTVIVSAAPTAFNDRADVESNGSVGIDVTANDTDSDGSINPATVTIAEAPSDGTALPQTNGIVIYTPNPGFSGKDTFSYTVRDNQGASSNVAIVSVTVGIVIDNGDPGTSYTGGWSVSGGANPYNPADSNATSLWARTDDTYTWTFAPSVAGNYEVYMWHTYASTRGSNVPVDIEHWGGTANVTVNQLVNPGQWNKLGTYPFAAGTGYDVTIHSLPDPYSTCADAVRFVHVPSNVVPLATISSISPVQALPGQTVTFAGTGTDFEGTISGYSWYSTLDGPLSNNATFSTSALSEGVHTIFFKVFDNNGGWSTEVQARVDVNNRLVRTTEHVFFAPAYASKNAMQLMVNTLSGMGATQSGGNWRFVNSSRNKEYIIHPVTSNQQFIDGLRTEGATILYFGHSNYGLGQLFATDQEFRDQVIEDIRYVDDDRILNTSSPVVHVSISGMRTGQAYPHWWPIFKDGTSAIMPYEKGDPAGPPAYNYNPTYQIPGDPTHYRIETVRHGAIERFSDWGGPAWYDPNGNPPDPNNPAHDQYFITNSEPWSPSFERVGNWVDTNTLVGFFRENYEYSAPGSGADRTTWMFDIPSAGNYNVYAWYPGASSNATNAPYTVHHASGSTTVPVNQRLNGGRWNLIGTYGFGVGGYSVELSDNASGGNVVADGIRVAHVDNPPEVLKAHFFATNRSGPAPLDVVFSAESIGDVDTYLWDFGDGEQNSTRTYILHTYTQPGTYTVSYTVNGPLGSDRLTKVGYIVVGEPEAPLQAEFESRSSQQGVIPSLIRFRDRSSGDIVSWQWDFNGDGVVDSTEQSPSFTYTTTGIFDVRLTVKDRNGESATIVKEDFIRMGLFDKNIDNVDYPKNHYRTKTLLFRKGLEVAKEEMRYARMFYGGCDSAHYYTDTFQRGIFHYAANTTYEGEYAMAEYIKAYMNGASDYELWQIIQAIEPLYDYYDFRKPPYEQW